MNATRALSIAAVLVACFAPSLAHAEDPADPAAEARQEYNTGMQAYFAKRFVEAALHFEAAAAQRAHAVTLYTAALAWEQANRPERAADDFARSLEVPGLNAQQTANAKDRLATLERSLGMLDVTAPEGWRVQLDALTEVPAPARLHATPGVHALTVHAPNKPITRRDVSLDLAQATRLALAEEPEAPSPKTPPPKPPQVAPQIAPPREAPEVVTVTKTDARTTIGVAAAGVGVALLAGGAVLGLNAVDARDAYNAAPSRAAYDHATSLQTWTNVAFVAGGVFAATGLVLVLWPSRGPSRDAAGGGAPASRDAMTLAPTLGGAVVRGAF